MLFRMKRVKIIKTLCKRTARTHKSMYGIFFIKCVECNVGFYGMLQERKRDMFFVLMNVVDL